MKSTRVYGIKYDTNSTRAFKILSIALAGIIGLSLGIAIAAWRRGARPVLALVNFVYTIPSIALFGFLIPVTGVGNVTAVVALTHQGPGEGQVGTADMATWLLWTEVDTGLEDYQWTVANPALESQLSQY